MRRLHPPPQLFWSGGSDQRILSLNDLIEIYYMSVGRGVNLLLNATPDKHGEVRRSGRVKRLQESVTKSARRFAKATVHGQQATGTS